MIFSKVQLLIPCLLGLVSCAVPSVKYTVFQDDAPRTNSEDYADTYMLSKTQLTLEFKPAKSQDGGDVRNLLVSLRRLEDPRYSFGITPWNRWYGVNTRVSIVKTENTQIVQSLSVSIEDKRKEFIESSFKLLGTLAQLTVASAAPGEKKLEKPYPVIIDTLSKLRSSNCERGSCSEIPLVPHNWGATALLEVGPVPPDAIDIRTVVSEQFLSKANRVLFSSACRQATLTIKDINSSDDNLVKHFSLADPRYVQLIGLPAKGQITAHTECGYSVVPENVVLQSNVDVAESFFSNFFKYRAAFIEKRDAEDNAETD
ncbi:hypothetical protein OKW12_001945 [Pseudomonas silensiensis]|nr:hypothetical protein [Pseudomonas silensiensis]